ncbi:citrate synthase-like protein [Crucibulum laeve]|uniref:Citrate synthase n=1 Tax=Crucibulum laeve TaxID=68775 RepID=A0A5C3LXY3_9AGAR|nr:citrate synthase-like protein [Crucibulum laeve]
MPFEFTTGSYDLHPRTLIEGITVRIPSRIELATNLVAFHAKAPIHQLTVENILGGMRGAPSIVWEISETDSSGVKYHGCMLCQLEENIPKWGNSKQLSPEAMLWYLYTASVPTHAELKQFAADLVSRCELPKDVTNFLNNLPTNLSPIIHMNMGLTVLAQHSKLMKALAKGACKEELWRFALEDALDATGCILTLVSRIHSNIYRQGRDRDATLDPSADLAQNFAIRMGRSCEINFVELTRLAWVLHQDHGANVSAHTMRLVSSALTDPYSTLSAGLIAGSGTLHGMAIHNSVDFNKSMTSALGPNPTDQDIENYVLKCIASGQILPGYGHAVLRVVDPRLEWIYRFVADHPAPLPESGVHPVLLELIQRANMIVPDLLRVHLPKIKNPAPNVDALSGSTMHTYGLDVDFILPFMACGRAMGFLAQSVWDKALGLPIERPLSITMDGLLSKLQPNV